jgi:hypothetical protein
MSALPRLVARILVYRAPKTPSTHRLGPPAGRTPRLANSYYTCSVMQGGDPYGPWDSASLSIIQRTGSYVRYRFKRASSAASFFGVGTGARNDSPCSYRSTQTTNFKTGRRIIFRTWRHHGKHLIRQNISSGHMFEAQYPLAMMQKIEM